MGLYLVLQLKMEKEQFEIEARRMRPTLIRQALRYMEDADEAEDVVQDVLLKLWFLRNRLDHYRNIEALAMVVTKHLCLNSLKQTRKQTVCLEEILNLGDPDTPEMKMMGEEQMQELLEMIAQLPDLQQAVLRMKHVEGFEVEEIAQLTGTNPVAVRTNLSRARKKIREQFLKNNKEWN